jgi:alpha-amylase/alpha-mannosidase (GH57 family)
VEQQLAAARELHWRRFGQWPAGCWLPEAAASDAALASVGAAGFEWTVVSAATLRRSFGDAFLSGGRLQRPGRRDGARPVVFFRDDGLSDRIGFEYQRWPARDAVADLVRRLEDIAASGDAQGGVVTLALDGENAWEHYPDNGWEFLSGLYAALAGHPSLDLTTFSRCLADPRLPVSVLGRLLAGSWAGGDLSHWIGNEAANRAWDRLVDAKLLFDRHDGRSDAQAVRQLAVCEGSDWFWWADGDANGEASARFHRLFEAQLAGLHRALGCDPPDQAPGPH